MSEMPLRLLNEWAKEEVVSAIGQRFEHLMQGPDGLTAEEVAAFRRQHRRVAKMLGFVGPTAPVEQTGKGKTSVTTGEVSE